MKSRIDILIAVISSNMARVAKQGNWPDYARPEHSLLARVPKQEVVGPGFDAGIACCLDLIPRNKQALASTLHAAYTEVAVEQVRVELELDDDAFADTETCWWLAASSVCEQGGVTQAKFKYQVSWFREVSGDQASRVAAARSCYAKMRKDFTVMADGVPFVTRDGGAQGAYVAGYDWAVQWAESLGFFFISTFHSSLGLEEFEWSDATDEKGRAISGPVHDSRQFVKAATLSELGRVVEVVMNHLGQP